MLCTCLFARDPNRFNSISYANWATIIFPISDGDGGGRTCLFLTTQFAILNVSLSPSLQGCCQSEHPFITSAHSCPIQSAPTEQSHLKPDLSELQKRACITHMHTCTRIHTKAAIEDMPHQTTARSKTLHSRHGIVWIMRLYTRKGYKKLVLLWNWSNARNCIEFCFDFLNTFAKRKRGLIRYSVMEENIMLKSTVGLTAFHK